MQKIKIETDDHSVTLKMKGDEGATWPDVLSTAIAVIRANYSYLSIVDIVDHLEEEYNFLREKKDEAIDETTFDFDNDCDDDAEWLRKRFREETGDESKEDSDSDSSTGAAVCGTAD